MSVAASIFVSMATAAFSPAHVDVLIGDTVVWRNNSQRTHNVKFDTEGFNSGRVAPRGAANHVFAAAGRFGYVCTIHDGMTGEVAVHPLLIDGPARPVRRGAPIALHVRAPENAGEVAIEADAGSGFRRVAVATPAVGGGHEDHAADGTLHATVTAAESATYRAISAAGASPGLRVDVTDGALLSARARRGRRGAAVVRVRATPSTPGARVVLQVRLRERFGWWPVDRARLNRSSRARLSVRGHPGARARVVLVGADWATPSGRSPAFRLPR